MSILTLEIKARIIRKLVQWKKWNENTESIIKRLPSHLRRERITAKALKELEKYEWIIPHQEGSEVYYSLNLKKIGKILKFYERYCKINKNFSLLK